MATCGQLRQPTPLHIRQETRSTAIDPPPEPETDAHGKRRAINSERKGVRYRSRLNLEKARSRAKAFFKAVAWRRQQETHSHSHKPSHQRARALKAVYAKGERTILVEIPNIPKTDTPAAFRQVKTDRQAKKIKQERQAIKKPRRKPSQGRYKLKPQSNSRGCSEMVD